MAVTIHGLFQLGSYHHFLLFQFQTINKPYFSLFFFHSSLFYSSVHFLFFSFVRLESGATRLAAARNNNKWKKKEKPWLWGRFPFFFFFLVFQIIFIFLVWLAQPEYILKKNICASAPISQSFFFFYIFNCWTLDIVCMAIWATNFIFMMRGFRSVRTPTIRPFAQFFPGSSSTLLYTWDCCSDIVH